ncbi:MAG: low molecular weight protein-tyrosine phosphatase [Streptosporangiaceae bacterium]|jgi:protein-tyrosine phosphatase|nr:protein tyrosine phosphatase [Streptosporangiaceae bacterium]MDX6434596.1 low molecular weight protein-tyrosine phosphatase [Streptosporangiaceae bacterium]
MSEPYRVTFVCTGNICRSPLAEHVLRRHAEEEGLDVEVDSSGTGAWHLGDEADHRTVQTLRGNGYTSAHRARQFEAEWFDDYDLIVALDNGHLQELRAMAPTSRDRDKIRLLREFDPQAVDADLDVPDPYYGGQEGFEHVLQLIEAAVPGLLDEVRRGLKARG